MLQEEEQNTSSATYRAVHLPEIVHAILNQTIILHIWHAFNVNTKHPVNRYYLVSKLWEIESRRVTWQKCGYVRGIYPKASDLLAIKDPARRQQYADHIRDLWIGIEDYDPGPWEGRLVPDLAKLSFPMLRNFRIDGPELHDLVQYQDVSDLSPFLQPRLHSLKIRAEMGLSKGSVVLSDACLSMVTRQCRHLEHLTLQLGDPQPALSHSAMASLFNSMEFLVKVALGAFVMTSMSVDSFIFLSRYQSLRQLDIYDIQPDWPLQLGPQAFPALRKLVCGISSQGLTPLLRFLPMLQTLHIYLNKPSNDVFHGIAKANLTQLEELRMQPWAGTFISAADLVLVARNAPNLHTLIMPTGEDRDLVSEISITGWTDNTLSDVARHVPQLKSLTVVCKGSELTDQGINQLGIHCPNLERFTLVANMDRDRFKQDVREEPFQRLKHWYIYDSAIFLR